MPGLDVLAPNYRRVQQRWRNAPTLTKCHAALRARLDTSGHGLWWSTLSYSLSLCAHDHGEVTWLRVQKQEGESPSPDLAAVGERTPA
jgi:hypothetical protein